MEGKLFGNLDHRLRTFRGIGAESRYGKTPRTKVVGDHEKRNPHYTVEPRYWVARSLVQEKLRERRWTRPWLVLYGRKNNRSNRRTFTTAVVPTCASVDVAPIVLSRVRDNDVLSVVVALAVGQSLVFDFLVRTRLIGFSIGKNLLSEIPVPEASRYTTPCPWEHSRTIIDWIQLRLLELTYTAWDLEPFARDCNWAGPPFRWNEDRRISLLCELDAAFFHLYLPTDREGYWRPARHAEGVPSEEPPEQVADLMAHFPNPRDAVSYILDTFPGVRDKDEANHGEYRTKRIILEVYDAMQAAIATGEAFRTRLAPPPADPSLCHRPRATVTVRPSPAETVGLP